MAVSVYVSISYAYLSNASEKSRRITFVCRQPSRFLKRSLKTFKTAETHTFESLWIDVDQFLWWILEKKTDNRKIIFAGDFDLPVDNSLYPYSTQFQIILDTFSLIQHGKSSTHTSDHCLDLVFTRRNDCATNSISIGPLFSDHFQVMCKLNFQNMDYKNKLTRTLSVSDIRLRLRSHSERIFSIKWRL